MHQVDIIENKQPEIWKIFTSSSFITQNESDLHIHLFIDKQFRRNANLRTDDKVNQNMPLIHILYKQFNYKGVFRSNTRGAS